MMRRAVLLGAVALVLVSTAALPASGAPRIERPSRLGFVKHFVVIYQENHSFDNLYGLWEGVNGLATADPAHTIQVKQDGAPYSCLLQDDVNLAAAAPQDCNDSANGVSFSSHFVNAPFAIDQYIAPPATTCPPSPAVAFTQHNGWLDGTGSPGGCTRDIVHGFYEQQYQINGGRMNRFVTGSDAAGLVMGHYDTRKLPIYRYLHGRSRPHYAILDNFFHAAFGGSFLNHQWLAAAATPTAPDTNHSVLDANGMPVPRSPPANQSPVPLYVSPLATAADRAVAAACPAPLGLACGNYATGTSQSPSQPHGSGFTIPLQTHPTIGDRLSDAGVGWAWYSGGWSNAAGLVGEPGYTNGNGTSCTDRNSFENPAPPYCPHHLFQFHHQPFNYFANYAEGAPGRPHLGDEAEFIDLVAASGKRCQLLPVSFVKPIGGENEHPGYSSEPIGSDHLVELLRAIGAVAAARTRW